MTEHRSAIRKAQDVKPLLRIETSQLCQIGHVTRMSPKVCGKLSHSGYRLLPWESSAKCFQRPKKLHLRPFLVPSWRGASRTIWDCCWSWGISGTLGAAGPAIFLKEQSDTKMSESMNM